MRYHSRYCSWGCQVVLWLCCLFISWRLPAQPVQTTDHRFWRVNGPVNDICVVSNIAFLGGDFTYVGPATANAAWVDLNTGAPLTGYPDLKGQIYCIIPDGSGGWFVGGKFVEAKSQLKNLVQVRSNGVINLSWAPNPNNTVWALAIKSNQVYVAGDFTQVSGGAQSFLVSLNYITAKTNNWAVKVSASVQALALADDTLYLGGLFTSVNNQNRQRLAALDVNTGALKEWNPGATGGSSVKTLTIEGGLIYVGGDFTTCGTKPRNRIAAVDAVTGVANSWNPNASATSGTTTINGIEVAGDSVYVGGIFTSIGGANRNRLANINKATGQANPAWDPNPSGPVEAMLMVGTNLVVVGKFGAIAGSERSSLAVFDVTSGVLMNPQVYCSTLAPNVSASVHCVAEQNGIFAIGGDFVSVGGFARKRLAALDLGTGAATAWNPGADDAVYVMRAAGQLLYVGGAFGTVGSSNLPRLAAVSIAEGQVAAWNTKSSSAAAHAVYDLAVVGDRMFVAGQFSSMGGEARNNLVELGISDAKATSWNPGPPAAVRALLVLNNNLYVGGDYRSIGGANRGYLSAFGLSDGKLITTFDPKANGVVRSLAAKGSRLYVGGDFTQIATLTRNRLAAISPDTGLETETWNPEVGVSGQLRVYSVVPTETAVYVGGNFTSVGGEYRKCLGGVTAAAAIANSWDPNPNNAVNSVVITSNQVLVGGDFTTMGGEFIPYFAVFSTQPSFIPGSVKANPDGTVEMMVADGIGERSSVLLQATDDLKNPNWQTIQTLTVSGMTVKCVDGQAAGKARCYYRLTTVP
jgi:hypothetical protein